MNAGEVSISGRADVPWSDKDRDESQWSSRYYKVDCPDLLYTMKIDGADDRKDPDNWFMTCILTEHDQHSVTRISPAEYRQLVNSDEWED